MAVAAAGPELVHQAVGASCEINIHSKMKNNININTNVHTDSINY